MEYKVETWNRKVKIEIHASTIGYLDPREATDLAQKLMIAVREVQHDANVASEAQYSCMTQKRQQNDSVAQLQAQGYLVGSPVEGER